MKRTLLMVAISFAVLLIVIPFCAERIDAGHVGIKVKLYGGDKGVQDVAEVTGMVWFNPFTTMVYEIPTYVQNAVYTLEEVDGSKVNEEFRVTTKDGLVAAFDVSINYYTPSDKVAAIFKKYRKPFDVLSKTIVRNYLRDAFKIK